MIIIYLFLVFFTHYNYPLSTVVGYQLWQPLLFYCFFLAYPVAIFPYLWGSESLQALHEEWPPRTVESKKKKTRGHRQNYLDKAPNLPLIASLSSLYFYFSIVSGNSNSKISILTWARISVFRNLHNLSALKPARVTIGEISYGPTSWTDTGTPTLLYCFLFSFFFCFLFSFCF